MQPRFEVPFLFVCLRICLLTCHSTLSHFSSFLSRAATCPAKTFSVTNPITKAHVYDIIVPNTPAGQWAIQPCPEGWNPNGNSVFKLQCGQNGLWNASTYTDIQCQKVVCSTGCDLCTEASKCTKCSAGLLLSNGGCFTSCPNGYCNSSNICIRK